MAMTVVVAAAGCASQKAEQRFAGEPADPSETAQAQAQAGIGGSGSAGTNRYVDEQLGFAVVRPDEKWQLEITGDQGADGVATPVVLRNAETGAQIVIQVAPAVATPIQFAERLTMGMRSHPGFTTSDPEPLAFSDNAVGFRFAMGDRVFGRVAVRDGAKGRVLMMLATWPAGATDAASNGVDAVFKTIEPVDLTPTANE